MNLRAICRVAALLVGVGLLPVLSVVIAGAVARWGDCTLHEGFVNPCVIFGHDFGELLYAMGVMGWLMLVSIPVAALGLLLFLWAGAVALTRRLRARR